MKLPWSKEQSLELKFGPNDSQESVEHKIQQLRDADRITHFEASCEYERSDCKVEYPTEDEAYAIYLDPNESEMMRTIAFFYAYHKHMNSHLTKQMFGSIGRFGNVDFYFIIRNPNYKGEGWRYRLTKLLRKWNLIEEFI